jgi:hypothetical protein
MRSLIVRSENKHLADLNFNGEGGGWRGTATIDLRKLPSGGDAVCAAAVDLLMSRKLEVTHRDAGGHDVREVALQLTVDVIAGGVTIPPVDENSPPTRRALLRGSVTARELRYGQCREKPVNSEDDLPAELRDGLLRVLAAVTAGGVELLASLKPEVQD